MSIVRQLPGLTRTITRNLLLSDSILMLSVNINAVFPMELIEVFPH